MNKPYVICHMYTSIDGRIDGKYMSEEGCIISNEYYDDKIFKVGTSMAFGRVTTKMYKATSKNCLDKYDLYKNNEDHIIKSDYYNFVFDRIGKCFYSENTYSYGGKVMQIVEVLSKKCDKRYLSYLRDIGISYIIVDSIKEALDKIYNLYNVKSLVLTGGATINGGFLKENMIDEISLIISPYIEGNDNYKTSFSLDSFYNYKFKFIKSNPLNDGGVELIFEKEKKI